MTTTAGEQRRPLAPAARPVHTGSWFATFRHTLDRPLTSYYLLLTASTLLLAIGLMEVLSASSVDGYVKHGNSYYWFFRQLTWVFLALPVAFVATRLPHKALRALAWPALLLAVVLLALTQTGLGVEVNGNRNWLALGPVVVQPAEVAKLAVILWCADVYARKERLLDDWKHTLIPVAPVMAMVVGLVLLGGDLGTALVLMAIILGMLWVVGAPARLFVGSMVDGRGVRALPRQHQQGAPGPAHQLRRPVQGLPGRGLAVRPRPVRDVQRRRCSARASAPASRSGARCPRRTPTSSSPCSARSSVWSARSWCSRCS